MKIVLIGLASIFTEGMTYQDNLLADQIRKDGHEVTIIADCYKFKNGNIVKVDEEDTILDNGIRLIRKKYKNFLGEFVSGKIRAVNGLFSLLMDLKPDIIFHHGLQSYEMLTIVKYKKANQNVKFYVDSHEDFHNSATNIVSKKLLHGIFYKIIIQRSLKYIDKVFCVAYESFDFLKRMYNVPEDIMEFYPLGGVVFEEKDRLKKRDFIRKELEIKEENILIIHTGKMNKLKRTIEVVNAFKQVASDEIHLILIGTLNEDIKDDVEKIILVDPRIKFLGWKNGSELMDYLCAGDLYLQPGTQSATMQNAACCKNALALYPYPSHKYLFKDHSFYIKSEDDIRNLLESILKDKTILSEKRENSYLIALEKLNYKALANRLYNFN